eukprot:TRINITY_DN5531_c0_g2_i3.p1 TRINITY_DN5531_c0_g2~~TRINITY_DN5531_c0_g2_i3.p1  ORF type:complete len:468 (-),score=103.31 TRINITY_DN5531_c0_g2_i3:91-1452(-)
MTTGHPGHADDVYAYICGRVSAILARLARGSGTVTPGLVGLDSELYGLHAVATQLSAAGDQFSGMEAVLAQLPAARDRRLGVRTKKPRCSSAQGARSAVLDDPLLLGHVLQFAGRSRWLYIAGVSPHWRGVYMATCAQHFGFEHLAKTAWREALCRVETLIVAADAGALEPRQQRALREQLGRWGTRATLACATGVGFGLELDGSMLVSAARSGRPDWFVHLGNLLKESDDDGFETKHLLAAAAAAAARGDEGGMLVWIAEAGGDDLPMWIVPGLANIAARCGHLETLRWVVETESWSFTVEDLAFAQSIREHHDAGEEYGYFVTTWDDGGRRYFTLIETAVRAGHLPIVQWVLDHVEVDEAVDTVVLAMIRRKLEVAQLLLSAWEFEEHASKSAVVASLAAKRCCPVALLMWARENGMGDWSPETLATMVASAEQARNAVVATWLRSLGAAH